MSSTRLNQIVAIEKGVKNRVYAAASEVYKTFQKPDLFKGQTRTYAPKDEDGERFNDETQLVQFRADELLEQVREGMEEHWDLCAIRDHANTGAKADVVVDDKVLLKDVPVTLLLFLEKQLSDLKDEVNKMPELDAAHQWTYDKASRTYRAPPVVTTKTKKLPKVVKKFEPTEHQPGQAEIFHEDLTIGHWTATPISGGVPRERKRELQKRMTALIKAVKFAREAANEVEISKVAVAKPVFEFLFGGLE